MTAKAQLALLPKEQPSEESLKSWALVELFGHQRIIGMMIVDPAEFLRHGAHGRAGPAERR